MSDETMKELTERIDAIAAKLGVASEHIWGVLVAQAQVEGAAFLIIYGGLLIAACFLGWRGVRGMILYCDLDENAQTDIRFAVPMSMIVVCGFLLFGLLLGGTAPTGRSDSTAPLISATTKLINPEYHAFREVARLVGK